MEKIFETSFVTPPVAGGGDASVCICHYDNYVDQICLLLMDASVNVTAGTNPLCNMSLDGVTRSANVSFLRGDSSAKLYNLVMPPAMGHIFPGAQLIVTVNLGVDAVFQRASILVWSRSRKKLGDQTTTVHQVTDNTNIRINLHFDPVLVTPLDGSDMPVMLPGSTQVTFLTDNSYGPGFPLAAIVDPTSVPYSLTFPKITGQIFNTEQLELQNLPANVVSIQISAPIL